MDTNMERSPSDTSLGKIESLAALSNTRNTNKYAINQLKHDVEQQLDKAIVNVRYAREMKLEEEIRKVGLQFGTENETFEKAIRRPLLDEFEKQMDIMKILETSMISELLLPKETIHTFPTSQWVNSLLSRIVELEREKNRLEAELLEEKTFNYTSGSQSLFNKDSYSSTSLSSINGSRDLQ